MPAPVRVKFPQEDIDALLKISKSRTIGTSYVDRARILLRKADGLSNNAIAEELQFNPKTVGLWVNRYINRPEGASMLEILRDAKGRGRKKEITGEARIAVTLIACRDPKEFGHPEELWSKRLFAKALRENAEKLGLSRLSTICATTAYKILKESDVQPWRIQYYCEKRDPDFNNKMHNVLALYRVIFQQFTWDFIKKVWHYTPDGQLQGIRVLTLDEKPGIQVLSSTSPVQNPVPVVLTGSGTELQVAASSVADLKALLQKAVTVTKFDPKLYIPLRRKSKQASYGLGTGFVRSRRSLRRTKRKDYEYKRHGTVSLIGAMDLVTGHVFGDVTESHNSEAFISFLKKIDAYYPKEDKIIIVLDNLKVHSSKRTREYLATVPGRFEFLFTPKHGSWLNMIEGFFGKLSRQLLRGINASDKDELTSRILKYLDQVNENPVVHHWTWGLDDLDPTLSYKTVTLLEDMG